MREPRLVSVSTPYLPIAKAIAPKAPSGAAFMMKASTLNTTAVSRCTPDNTGAPREHPRGQPLHPRQHGRAHLADRVEGHAEDHRHEDDLQDVALDEGPDDAVRKKVKDEVVPVRLLPRRHQGADGLRRR